MNRYAIIGSGALGGLYGAMLAKAGHQVHFLLRSDYQHVAENGLRIESIWGDFELPRPNIHRDAADIPHCDVTIVATKTTQNKAMGELLKQSTAGGGVVLVLQNGLSIESPAVALVGSDRVYSGCCFLCSNKIGPGHIRHLDQGRIVFGRLSGPADSMANQIAGDMTAAGIPVKTTDDVAMVRWRKLMWNIPFNGLSVVLNASTKQLIQSDAATALATRIIDEVYTAALSVGVKIPADQKQATLEATRTMVPYDSSMRLDFLAGRPMEIEAIYDNPISASKTPMPSVAMLRDQLSYLESSRP